MIYFYVADLGASLETLKQKGGQILSGPREYGEGAKFAVIKDPAGACCALFEEGEFEG